jgi:hypothetical protein
MGFVNLKGESFDMLAGNQNKLAGECFMIVLTAVIDEFGVPKADPKIKYKLKLAQMLPFTDTPAEGGALERAMLG